MPLATPPEIGHNARNRQEIPREMLESLAPGHPARAHVPSANAGIDL